MIIIGQGRPKLVSVISATNTQMFESKPHLPAASVLVAGKFAFEFSLENGVDGLLPVVVGVVILLFVVIVGGRWRCFWLWLWRWVILRGRTDRPCRCRCRCGRRPAFRPSALRRCRLLSRCWWTFRRRRRWWSCLVDVAWRIGRRQRSSGGSFVVVVVVVEAANAETEAGTGCCAVQTQRCSTLSTSRKRRVDIHCQ